MVTPIKSTNRRHFIAIGTLAATIALATLKGALADEPYYMAPPISTASISQPSASSVFNFNEVPQGQEIVIERAAFDQGGYQLYDTVGETIIVPFTNDNLYVMKFAVSNTGQTYFVNEGGTPTLYVPRGGYLENATVRGARWYPFSDSFHPSTPVFVGIAPSWSAFIGIGWYSGMNCYGGYWCERPFGVFVPCSGFYFRIGSVTVFGWDGYRDYYYDHHDGWEHVGYYDHDYYRWGGRPYGGREFHGGREYAHGGGDHDYRSSHEFHGGQPSWTHRSDGDHSFNGGGFHSYGDSGSNRGSDHTFRGGSDHWSGAGSSGGSNHSFNEGGRSSDSGSSNGGSNHSSDSGHSFNGGSHSPDSGHSFNGGGHGGGSGSSDGDHGRL